MSRTSRILAHLIVSNARDMSTPILWNSHCRHCTTAIKILCTQTTSAQLRPCLKPACVVLVNMLTFFCMHCRVMSEMTFVVQLRRTIGQRLVRGPTGFFGFGNAISVPFPKESSDMCCSNIMLTTLDRYAEIDSDTYFNSSLLMLSGLHNHF